MALGSSLRRTLVRCVLGLTLLSGCPQLLADDFEMFQGTAPGGDRYQGGDLGPDASAEGQDPADAAPDADPSPPDRPDARGSEDPPDADAARPDASVPDAAEPSDAGLESESGAPPDDPELVALREALIHRYRFNLGASLVDSVGGANAVSQGVTFSTGAAVFAGTDQYLDLPNTLLSGVTNVTFEAWVIWDVTDPNASTSEWQRIFDFGSNSSSIEGQQGSNANGVFLSPRSSGAQGKLHLEYRGGGNINLDAPEPLPVGVQVQVVAVLDDDGDLLSLYQNGALKGARGDFTGSLTTVTYQNNWLGRSQYTGNPSFKGRILDFRIYDTALSSALIQATFAAGPDADW